MNADARDIALYERCREIARETGVVITVKYDAFFLSSCEAGNQDDNESLGAVVSLDELYGFLCGYEHYASAKSLLNLAERASG